MPMQGEAIEFDEHARTQEIHMISSHTNRQTYAKLRIRHIPANLPHLSNQ